jgi:molybdopterin molybdotransferase
MELTSFISLDEAVKRGKIYVPRTREKKVPLLEAVGKYSMEEIESPSDFPPFDRSAVDGYAVNSRETISSTKTNPSTFKLLGRLFPSSEEGISVEAGQSVVVTTGARMPQGTDSVVMLEDALEDGNELKVFVPVRKFQNVSRKGEDLKRGFRILKRGEKITPPHVAALMEYNIKEVAVCSLSVGIVSTGDELVSGKVINSTQPFIQSLIDRSGFHAVGYGAVSDDKAEIERVMSNVKEDVIIMTGGTGPGERDILPSLMEAKGKLVFRGVRIRPGRTTSLGVYKGKPVFMISGLPVAALIASENLILRLIHEWMHLLPQQKETREGILERSVVNTLGFRSYVRVKTEMRGGELRVIPTRVTGSGVIYSVIDADGILVIDENSEGIQAGERVKIEVLRW